MITAIHAAKINSISSHVAILHPSQSLSWMTFVWILSLDVDVAKGRTGAIRNLTDQFTAGRGLDISNWWGCVGASNLTMEIIWRNNWWLHCRVVL